MLKIPYYTNICTLPLSKVTDENVFENGRLKVKLLILQFHCSTVYNINPMKFVHSQLSCLEHLQSQKMVSQLESHRDKFSVFSESLIA